MRRFVKGSGQLGLAGESHVGDVVLRAQGLTKRYGRIPAVDDVNVVILRITN